MSPDRTIVTTDKQLQRTVRRHRELAAAELRRWASGD